MKTIFRQANIGLLMAAIIALGAVAGFAQDPCTDAEGQTTLGDKFRELYPKKDLESRKLTIDTGKQFLEKYGACPSATDLNEYLKGAIPKLEDSYKKALEVKKENDMIAKFNAALGSKNWDEVYASGKEVLASYPDKYRDVELALGSIGYDESFKGNFKYNDDTLKYAKMAIADLETGKTFSASFGVPKDFVYKSKDNALGWMNMIIGYITSVAQKNRPASLPYLYKATQSTSLTPDSTAKNPIPFELIGKYYFDELNKLTDEITTMGHNQPPDGSTPEVMKAAVDAIKAKVAMSNGTSERAMDAFSRAYTLAASTPAAKPYKDQMRKNVEDAYKLRFAKSEGVDAWIAEAVKKPLVNPTTAVTPIFDPEPVAPAPTTTTTSTPTTTTTTVKPPVSTPVKPGDTGVKPVPAPGTKPATPAGKPAAGAKPQAKVKKPVVKKKAA